MPHIKHHVFYFRKRDVYFFAGGLVIMSEMHESVQRLLILAAKKLGKPRASKKELAALLGISPQTLTNWASRGVSREGAMLAEQHLGTTSTFVRDGRSIIGQYLATNEQYELNEAPAPEYNPWPFRQVTPAQIKKLTLEELEYVEAIIQQKLAARVAPAPRSSAKSEP